jgi:isoquinoline 1-oxidoreductase subunit alpha
MIAFSLNGKSVEVDVASDTPLLWVIRDTMRMTGTKFGCGAGLCGACTVHVEGEAEFACQIELGAVQGKAVTTIEGLSPDRSHPLQKAWIEKQVPQCGYCQSGQIMRAAALLKRKPKPTREEIVEYMKPNLCRCGTYNRIVVAIEFASRGG